MAITTVDIDCPVCHATHRLPLDARGRFEGAAPCDPSQWFTLQLDPEQWRQLVADRQQRTRH